MRPLKLQFKGINSFSEQTVIDFEKLTKRGIFGIFGDTGSGKSTILDCINFALYGRVERSREKLDIINYRSDAAEVKFDFDVVSDGKRKKYSIERSIKKKSGTHKASLYEDGICIADNASTVTKKITDILGVDAEDFRKCIALPQGEFSQFVKSQPSDRIALIERLFSLSKYGDRLKEKLKLCGEEANILFRELDAKLQMFSDISEETISLQRDEIKKAEKDIALLEKRKATAENKYSALKSLSNARKELDGLKEKLSETEAQRPQIEQLRVKIKSLPVCKSVLESNEEFTIKSRKRINLEQILTAVDKEIKNSERQIEEFKNKLDSEKYDERLSKCVELAAKYKTCEGKPDKLKQLEKQLEAKRVEFRKKEEELNALIIEAENKRKEVSEAEKQLSQCGFENLDILINTCFKGAVLRDEYVNSLDYFVGLKKNVELYDNDTPLYSYIIDEIENQIKIFKDRVFQVKDFNLKDAENRLKDFQVADSRRKELADKLSSLKIRLNEAEAAVKHCESEAGRLKSEGESLRASYDEAKDELVKVFGKDVNDFSFAIRENAVNRERLEREKQKALEEGENLQKHLSELRIRFSVAEAELKAVSTEAENISRKIKELLEKSGLQSIENCKKIAEEFASFPDAEKTLEDFDAKFISLKSRYEQLNKTDGILKFSEQEFVAAESEKNTVDGELSTTKEKLAVLKNNYDTVQARLKEKQSLHKEFVLAEKRNNLIGQLKDLAKGNKFMEFIANEYLYDISSLASSTLLNLTDGRYFLTYTDTFYAGDNYDCGNLRGVNTLSGGETFLVSLSLALALSQTICASLKSIEFFFLDEGFGTLDGALVDTVMNALEKLKGSHFTIGVISHVEELKHRIDSKIIVNKATETHGSTVQMSC